MKSIVDDLSIVLGGEAGQGIQTIEAILISLLKKEGYNVFATKEYMSRVRGGVNSTEIRISSKPVASFIDRIDILIPLSIEVLDHLKTRINPDTIILGEKDKINYTNMIDIPLSRIADSLGDMIYSNIAATGVIAGILEINEKLCESCIIEFFTTKSYEIKNKNIEAIKKGYEIGKGLSENIKIKIKKNNMEDSIILTGADSVALGAIAGGCNYVCAYPMSPSTSVLEKMALYSNDFDILVEQVEDEVGVVNMALGAWYAGARALVTTSGGGFALMSEGISLAGMIESPLVIHLAQRPGPATGLPTRTEQGDLNLALYAGHGDFPRIILSPGNLDEGFELSALAFELSDKFQVPVFILTDQYFIDSYYNIAQFDLSKLKIINHIVKTNESYKRYRFTEDGVSPRGIPGFGLGNVCVDSDEHDEEGYITEDPEMRIQMVDKRLKKETFIKDDIIKPKLIGRDDYKILIICWGSTLNTVVESVENLNNKDIAILHYSWIYPLSDDTQMYLKKAKELIIVENNATSQFGKLLKLNTGIEINTKILKYNGLPFTVEEITARLLKTLNKEE